MVDLSDIKKAKGLKICHINVRSVLNKIDQFRLHFENSGIDIIAVSETWLTKDIGSNILQMKYYQLFRWDREWTQDNGTRAKKGGGLMVYIRDELNFTPIVDVAKNVSNSNCELQRIELCSNVQKNIVLFNIYRPRSGRIDPFVEHLTLKHEAEMGDTNCDESVSRGRKTGTKGRETGTKGRRTGTIGTKERGNEKPYGLVQIEYLDRGTSPRHVWTWRGRVTPFLDV